ncbi:putative fatty-acid--CoA ligase [Rhodococcus opacus B4]|uniref:Putative fatty-acid--CoA ligase n=1 Tax=Rhodococcus opacus (strain B4) TaxID=632772 RepID=C1B4R9_RHOOB|nr:putative fatty-acid--CoA ligase [Rhodococcus opacus B4]
MPTDFVSHLRTRVATYGDDRSYVYHREVGRELVAEAVTYRELDRDARALAVWLSTRPEAAHPVMLLYVDGIDFLRAFLGCLYAGVVAVPAPVPHDERSMQRVATMFADADVRLVLTTSAVAEPLDTWIRDSGLAATVAVAATDTAEPGDPDDWRPPGLDAGTLAFLQYTSGSTSEPKGVMVTHGNLAAQRRGHDPRHRRRRHGDRGRLAPALPRHGADRDAAAADPLRRQPRVHVADGLPQTAGALVAADRPLSRRHDPRSELRVRPRRPPDPRRPTGRTGPLLGAGGADRGRTHPAPHPRRRDRPARTPRLPGGRLPHRVRHGRGDPARHRQRGRLRPQVSRGRHGRAGAPRTDPEGRRHPAGRQRQAVRLRHPDRRPAYAPAAATRPGRGDLDPRRQCRRGLLESAGRDRGEVPRHPRRRRTVPAYRRPRGVRRRAPLRHRTPEGPADRQRPQPVPTGHRGSRAGRASGAHRFRRGGVLPRHRAARAAAGDPRGQDRADRRPDTARTRPPDPARRRPRLRRPRAECGARRPARRAPHHQREGPAPIDARASFLRSRVDAVLHEDIDPAVQRLRTTTAVPA